MFEPQEQAEKVRVEKPKLSSEIGGSRCVRWQARDTLAVFARALRRLARLSLVVGVAWRRLLQATGLDRLCSRLIAGGRNRTGVRGRGERATAHSWTQKGRQREQKCQYNTIHEPSIGKLDSKVNTTAHDRHPKTTHIGMRRICLCIDRIDFGLQHCWLHPTSPNLRDPTLQPTREAYDVAYRTKKSITQQGKSKRKFLGQPTTDPSPDSGHFAGLVTYKGMKRSSVRCFLVVPSQVSWMYCRFAQNMEWTSDSRPPSLMKLGFFSISPPAG